MLRVNGGPTGAGTRIIREARELEWDHWCSPKRFVKLSSTYVRCPHCGTRRP